MSSIQWNENRLWEAGSEYTEIAPIAAMIKATLVPLRQLYDALETELDRAVKRGDSQGAAMVAWRYGEVSSLVSRLEQHLDALVITTKEQS